MKRSMQRKQSEQQAIPAAMDYSKTLAHIKLRQALNEGMTIGFVACMEMIKETLQNVPGIGNKKVESILSAFQIKLEEYKNKLNS
ncbi:hypothetical protein UFOVP103_35 [uncultured Caudovirales phage]|uniref:Uncharacterized protein n=1 Tax=uncultured Caudovirales phage TaxID=2100421 RepID=A0A6J7WHI7_9CAUD|nr:hypothetical protein UFOVP103_35 [uncultured Caudovirales phage]CAB5216924.1 hypothetical protein UFOVP197_20 [uncultured Caudovirales phage]